MARPRLDPTEKRTESVRLSLTPAEKAQLLADADKASMPPAEYARRVVLGHRFRVVQSRTPDTETMAKIDRIGININQIAKAMNSHRMFAPAELSRCCDAMAAFYQWWMDDKPRHQG